MDNYGDTNRPNKEVETSYNTSYQQSVQPQFQNQSNQQASQFQFQNQSYQQPQYQQYNYINRSQTPYQQYSGQQPYQAYQQSAYQQQGFNPQQYQQSYHSETQMLPMENGNSKSYVGFAVTSMLLSFLNVIDYVIISMTKVIYDKKGLVITECILGMLLYITSMFLGIYSLKKSKKVMSMAIFGLIISIPLTFIYMQTLWILFSLDL